MEPTATPPQRQATLLAEARRYLAGGGTVLFLIAPELDLVVERGEGSRVWGRRDRHRGASPGAAPRNATAWCPTSPATASRSAAGFRWPPSSSATVMSVLDARNRPRSEVVWATNTLNGNPICAAAGVAALGELAWRWAYELIKRGLLVNPNEKSYISVAHTDADADVDRTLAIADQAFAALSGSPTHFASSPPEGAQASLLAARREA